MIEEAMTTGTTIVQESPSLLRVWWKNKNLQYDVAMSSVLIILNIAAIVYITTQKIPFPKVDKISFTFLPFTIMLYVPFGVYSCVVWFKAIEDVSWSKAYLVGRICHTFGFCNFLVLLYYISPHHLALHLGLPCLLWFVAAMIVPCCPCLWKGLCSRVGALRDWWEHVTRPQSEVVIV